MKNGYQNVSPQKLKQSIAETLRRLSQRFGKARERCGTDSVVGMLVRKDPENTIVKWAYVPASTFSTFNCLSHVK